MASANYETFGGRDIALSAVNSYANIFTKLIHLIISSSVFIYEHKLVYNKYLHTMYVNTSMNLQKNMDRSLIVMPAGIWVPTTSVYIFEEIIITN